MDAPTVEEWGKTYFLTDPVAGLRCLRAGRSLDHLLPEHMRPKPLEPRVRPRLEDSSPATQKRVRAAIVKRRLNTPGWVYFCQAGIGGPIKIGITKGVYNRLINLQIGCPVEMLFLGAFQADGVREQALQFEFGACRFRGEWYWPTQALLARVTELTAGVVQPMALGPLIFQQRD